MAPEPPAADQGQVNLPAPYRSPWLTLGENLRAVGADVVLRLRELLRRNREGGLWRPRWWPLDLAPLFWPLLVGAALALILFLVLLVPRSWKPALETPPLAQLDERHQASPEELPPTDLSPEPLPIPARPDVAAEPAITSVEPGITAGEPAGQPESEPQQEPEPESQPSPEPQPEPAVDPLQLLMQRPEADGLLRSAEGLPDQGRLLLRLAPSFSTLSSAEQQRRANQWQQWAGELGYDHLDLRDSRGGLLARDALVGEGMIVLDSSPQP